MKLKEIFDQLTSGELSQVALGGGEAGSIAVEKYPTAVNHVNLGLAALFTRFSLREGLLEIALQAGRRDYPLLAEHSTFSLKKPVEERFITTDFKDDLLKVERILTDDGTPVALNREGNKWSITTPQMHVLRLPPDLANQVADLPDGLKTTGLEVYYRARHPKIVINPGYWDPERVEIELPYAYLQALLYFVASRVHNPIGMGQEFNAGNNWMARYEAECSRLELEGVEIDTHQYTDRFSRNGWA